MGASRRWRFLSWSRRYGICGALLIGAMLALGSSRRAQAAEAKEPSRLFTYWMSYRLDTNAACPSEASFRHLIEERTPRSVYCPDCARVDFEVTLTLSPHRSVLTFAYRAGKPEIRWIDVQDCQEAVDAAALIFALAVENQANSPEDRANTDVSQPPRSDGIAVPSVGSDRPQAAPERPIQPVNPLPQVRESSSVQSWSPRFGVGAVARIASGIAPNPLFGGSGLVALDTNLASDRALRFSPRLMLMGGAATSRASWTSAGERVFFSTAGAQLQLCPFEARLTSGLWLEPCAGLELNRLKVRGSGNTHPVRLWMASPTAQLWLKTAIAGGFELIIGPGLAVTTRHDRFRYSPAEWNHQIQPISWNVTFGLEWDSPRR